MRHKWNHIKDSAIENLGARGTATLELARFEKSPSLRVEYDIAYCSLCLGFYCLG
jgi:hypothetical protein